MKKKYILVTIFFIYLLLMACTQEKLLPQTFHIQWQYNHHDEIFYEKHLLHVSNNGYSSYLIGNGEGSVKLLTLSPHGKKIWEKPLDGSFTFSSGREPVLYLLENKTLGKYQLTTGKRIGTIKSRALLRYMAFQLEIPSIY
jgi:hypothetical protein